MLLSTKFVEQFSCLFVCLFIHSFIRPSESSDRQVATAAGVVSGIHKSSMTKAFLLRLLHSELHWLDVPERVVYKQSS